MNRKLDRQPRVLKLAAAVLAALAGAAPSTMLIRPALAQDVYQDVYYDAASPSDPVGYVPRDTEELKRLAAPVALYPDAVLAQVLVACTYPQDVTDAAGWLDAGNDPQFIDDQNWDPSVRGIAHYPDVLRRLAADPDWMNDLGDAFLNQPSDVMNAVQLLRAEASAAGNLACNDQQQVIVDQDDPGVIEIIPTTPQYVYVPVYDPAVVYVERPHWVGEVLPPCETFGAGVVVGDWLCHDLDWHDRGVYVGAWGQDRPWWHYESRDGRAAASARYVDDRPGTYRPARVENVTVNKVNNITNVQNVTNVKNVSNVRDVH